MRKLLIAIAVLCLSACAAAQSFCNKTSLGLACTNTQTTAVSATALTINNDIGGANPSFEYILTGSPTITGIVLQGCKMGKTCVTLDTYTTGVLIRDPGNYSTTGNCSTFFDYFVVTATWTGGTSPTFTVNTSITTAAGKVC